VHTVCATFNPVSVAEDWRVCDVPQSLGKMIGRIVVLSPSGSGSQRRMKMRAQWSFRISGTACLNYSVPDDLNPQAFEHSLAVFQLLW